MVADPSCVLPVGKSGDQAEVVSILESALYQNGPKQIPPMRGKGNCVCLLEEKTIFFKLGLLLFASLLEFRGSQHCGTTGLTIGSLPSSLLPSEGGGTGTEGGRRRADT